MVLTTSFPLTMQSASGVFVERLVRALPEDVRATVLTPASDSAHPPTRRGRYAVVPVRYAPRSLQRLAHVPGGVPVALRSQPWLWLLVPILIAALFIACVRALRRSHVAHANWSACGVIAGLAGALLRRPVVTSLRGEDVARLESSALARLLLRLCAALSDRLVTVSAHMLPLIERHLGSRACKASFIPNGVDDDLLTLPIRDGTRASGRRLLAVGSLIARKRLDTIVRALAEPGAADAELVLVGDGPERERLDALARSLGVQRRVRFVGALEPGAMPGAYREADVFILASAAEGRANVLIEAMASGLPVVVSDIPGARDVIEPGRNGLLFTPGDAAALARVLGELSVDAALAARLAGAGRQWVRDQGLTWAAAGARYASLYRELVRARRATGR